MARAGNSAFAHMFKMPKLWSFPLRMAGALFGALVCMAASAMAGDQDTYQKALDSVGGRAALEAVLRVEARLSGINYEPMENVVVETPIHTSDDKLRILWEPGSNRFRRETVLETIFPFKGSWTYQEVFNGSAGILTGRDGFRPSAEKQLAAARIGADLKEFWLFNPQFLLAHARPVEGASSQGSSAAEITLSLPDRPTSWRVRLDRERMLPVRLSVTEQDPVFGPVEVTATFSDWRELDGIMTPFRVVKRVDGAWCVRKSAKRCSITRPAKAMPSSCPTNRRPRLWMPLSQAGAGTWRIGSCVAPPWPPRRTPISHIRSSFSKSPKACFKYSAAAS